MSKVCRRCEQWCSEDQFYKGQKSWCKSCVIAYQKERKRGPEQSRDAMLKHHYGLTLAEYQLMLERQGGRCAVCPAIPKEKSFHVDHDHSCCPGPRSCGRCVRGILCHNCNSALGHAKDDVERLKNLVNYLEASRVLTPLGVY